ncbi:MAG: formylglycine-generating enzyme family protein [Bacteroidales bacterium]|nr:formylglycine-generating enzyme family protein [Bacteroidales bacterium]
MLQQLYIILIFFSISSISQAHEFVEILKNDNVPNPQGFGIVPYNYEIGKYEITNYEYCIFLNKVATQNDSHNLFSPLMEQHFMGGIIRRQLQDGTYSYICKPGYENLPVVCTTWMSAIRYINWLHYNACNIEEGRNIKEWSSRTEGNELIGAYDTRIVPERRNSNARYWLPNRSEWERAAYFDGYKWMIDESTEGANCYSSSEGWLIPYPHIAEVGLSEGPNGTFDQCGNAAEWIESKSESNVWKLALGGSLIRPINYSYLGVIEGDFPEKAISTFGFRICRTTDKSLLETPVDSVIDNSIQYVVNNNLYDNQGTEYVYVSDIDNHGDCVYQFKGAVPYEYSISKTELSNEEYCRFLNSVATISDPYKLYNENMSSGVCGGIFRVDTADGYQYECKPNWEKRPVVYISYYDLARYANWMHYGCPQSGGAEQTTEGTKEQGAYDTSDFEIVRFGHKKPYKDFGKRNEGARFWIPSEDEWYKAAYYDPTIIGNRKYHNYPTKTDDSPTQAEANYMVDNVLCIGEPYFVAPVDSFSLSPSYYGTLQQGGNVWEWLEDWQYGVVGCRGLRGGSWSYTAYGLNACNTDPGGIDDRSYVFGGRLCMAVNDSGWQKVSKPVSTSIYEWFMSLSIKRILFLIGCFILGYILLFAIILYLIRDRKIR